MWMYALTFTKAHPSFISLSLPLSSPPLFIPFFTWALTRRSQRKARWVIRALGSPLCHHSDTTVPPTGCVTSKECVPHPPSAQSPPHTNITPLPPHIQSKVMMGYTIPWDVQRTCWNAQHNHGLGGIQENMTKSLQHVFECPVTWCVIHRFNCFVSFPLLFFWFLGILIWCTCSFSECGTRFIAYGMDVSFMFHDQCCFTKYTDCDYSLSINWPVTCWATSVFLLLGI